MKITKIYVIVVRWGNTVTVSLQGKNMTDQCHTNFTLKQIRNVHCLIRICMMS